MLISSFCTRSSRSLELGQIFGKQNQSLPLIYSVRSLVLLQSYFRENKVTTPGEKLNYTHVNIPQYRSELKTCRPKKVIYFLTYKKWLKNPSNNQILHFLTREFAKCKTSYSGVLV